MLPFMLINIKVHKISTTVMSLSYNVHMVHICSNNFVQSVDTLMMLILYFLLRSMCFIISSAYPLPFTVLLLLFLGTSGIRGTPCF